MLLKKSNHLATATVMRNNFYHWTTQLILLLNRQLVAPYRYKGEVSFLFLPIFPLPAIEPGLLPYYSSGAHQPLPCPSDSLIWQELGQLLISKSMAHPEHPGNGKVDSPLFKTDLLDLLVPLQKHRCLTKNAPRAICYPRKSNRTQKSVK